MPGSPPPAGPFVYQLRVVLRGVSPLIWRRLLVRSDTSIADLHTTLQLALGWSDEHLNRLVIHGRDYGVAARVVSGSGTTRMRSSLPISACASANGSSTSTTSSTAKCHDIRVEAILPVGRGRRSGLHRRPSLRPAGGMRRAVGLPGAAPVLAAPAHRAAGGAPRGRPRPTRRGPRRSLRGARRAVWLVAARSLRPEGRQPTTGCRGWSIGRGARHEDQGAGGDRRR